MPIGDRGCLLHMRATGPVTQSLFRLAARPVFPAGAEEFDCDRLALRVQFFQTAAHEAADDALQKIEKRALVFQMPRMRLPTVTRMQFAHQHQHDRTVGVISRVLQALNS